MVALRVVGMTMAPMQQLLILAVLMVLTVLRMVLQGRG
jgi:hypothetical protein